MFRKTNSVVYSTMGFFFEFSSGLLTTHDNRGNILIHSMKSFEMLNFTSSDCVLCDGV